MEIKKLVEQVKKDEIGFVTLQFTDLLGVTKEIIIPLRLRMTEDMRIRGMGDKAQKSHIRALKDFAGFLKRSPDTATGEDLRAYQLHMTG